MRANQSRPAPAVSGRTSVVSTSPTPETPVTYLSDLLNHTRGELNRADSKASLLLATLGVIISSLIGGLATSAWRPAKLAGGEQVLFWIGVVAAAGGVFWIAASVFPRIRQSGTPHPGVPAYYGDVAVYRDVDAFRAAIDGCPEVRDRLINQTFVIAGIVQTKYVLLRRGLLWLLAAILTCSLAVVLNAVLGPG